MDCSRLNVDRLAKSLNTADVSHPNLISRENLTMKDMSGTGTQFVSRIKLVRRRSILCRYYVISLSKHIPHNSGLSSTVL